MSKLTLVQMWMFGLLIAAGVPSTEARALLYETFVSGSGADSNTCDRTAPCATFNTAIGKTAAGGLIVVLDPGEYGSVIINKSISIVNGTNGSATTTFAPFVVNSSDAYIWVNAGPSDVVSLRGLTIRNVPGFSNAFGVLVQSARKVVIDNCVIGQHTNGISIAPTTGDINVEIIGTRIENNTNNGLLADGTQGTGQVEVQIKDSVIAGNNTGVYALSGSALDAISLSNSLVADNRYGVGAAGPQGVVILDHTTIQANSVQAVYTAGNGVVFSYGNNPINNNAALGSIPTVIGLH